MMRLRRDLAAAWANARPVVVVIFAAGLLAGALLSWMSGFTPRVGRYQFQGNGTLTTRIDTMTGEVVALYLLEGEVYPHILTEKLKTK